MAIEVLIGDVPEQSASTITVVFRDSAGALVVPTTVKYRIDCVTTSAAIKAETVVTPASTVTIQVLADENKIQAQANEYETKEITVISDDGLLTECHASARWRVKNLMFVI
jgi:hypothetical protein